MILKWHATTGDWEVAIRDKHPSVFVSPTELQALTTLLYQRGFTPTARGKPINDWAGTESAPIMDEPPARREVHYPEPGVDGASVGLLKRIGILVESIAEKVGAEVPEPERMDLSTIPPGDEDDQ